MLPLEFLQLAEWLLAQDFSPQARLRTAVSRAYYAAFLEARTRIIRYFPEIALVKGGEIHGRVREGLKRKRRFVLADKLFRLFKKRGCADYDLAYTFDDDNVQKAIALSENILQELTSV